MGNRYKEVGGGPATGLAENWIKNLQSFMGGGSTPGAQMTRAGNNQAQAGTDGALTNAAGGTGGIYNIIQDILSQGGGNLGGHLGSQITRGVNEGRNDVAARFSSIGGGMGSGAAQAIARYNAEQADAVPLGIAGLQMQTIGPLLQYIQQMAGRGVSQRQTVVEQNPWLQGLQTVAGVAQSAAGIRGGMQGGGGGDKAGFELPKDFDYSGSNLINATPYATTIPQVPRPRFPWER